MALHAQLYEEIHDEHDWPILECRPSVVKFLVVMRGANGFGYKDKVRLSPLVPYFFLQEFPDVVCRI